MQLGCVEEALLGAGSELGFVIAESFQISQDLLCESAETLLLGTWNSS